MVKKYYEMVFEVTETCQNGKERRIKKTVLSPIFKDGIHILESYRLKRGIETLESLHYYNIEYLETKTKTLLFID